MKNTGYKIVEFPKTRLATSDVGIIASRRHHVACFLEIDVTAAVKMIKEQKKRGTGISFTSWFIESAGSVLYEHGFAHAALLKRHRLVMFDDVDIAVPVERDVDGVKVPLVTVVRSADKKSAAEIYRELKEARTAAIRGEKDYVLGGRFSGFAMKLYYRLPQWCRVMFLKRMMKDPFRMKQAMGTAIVTTVGASAAMAGWILPKTMHNCCFAIGSITKKPRMVKNKVRARDVLHLTVLFDHDVIDGAPAARFVQALTNLLEGDFEI